jgi:phage head maturation protease
MKGRSMEEQGSLPMLTRGAASFVPTSINEADRTVDLVWSTGADVRRQGLFSGPFVERLDMSDEAVDLSRLNNGANLLDSHNASGGIRNVLGVVVDGTAEVKGPKGRRQGRATVRFSNRADVEPVWNDVKAGILRNISVGYSVEDWQRIEPAAVARDQTPVMIAKRWTPQEISLVSVPADAGAQVRSGAPEFPCVIHRTAVDPLAAPLPYPATDEEPEGMQPQTATRTAERADEDQPPKAQEQQAPGTATPNPPMDINERPADPKTSENEGPAPQVKPGTAPAVDPQTGVVQPGAPTVVGSAQTVVGNQPAAPAQQPRQPEAQPKAEGEGERSAPAGGNPRGLGAGDCADLVRSATGLGLAADFAADLIGREGMTADRARQLIIDEAAKLQEGTRVHPVTVTSVRDEDETRARSLSAALLHKRYPSAFPLAGAEGDLARQWMGMPLLHMARVELERAGYRDAWTMSPNEAAHRALMPGYGVRQGGYLGIRTGGLQTRDVGGLSTTSDFASVLLDVIHKSARQAYDLLQPTYTPIARQATHRDYRLYNSVQLSNLGTLSRVREHGEYVSTTLTDSKEAYAVAKYGARVGITREALINDDMGMLTDIPAKFGTAARNTESDIVWSIFLANAAMADGVTLFHASHGNLAGSAGAPSITTAGSGFSDMAVQKDPDGKTFLNIQPRYVIAPPLLWAVIAQLTGQITPNVITSSNVTPDYIGRAHRDREPRLQGGVTLDGVTYSGSNTAWYAGRRPGSG